MIHSRRNRPALALLAAGFLFPGTAAGQSRDHGVPTPPGQAAFEAIADVVERLDADPDTDWTRVDVEGLRRHLVDMDRVLMEARVETTDVPGGARFLVTGTGEAVGSIRRMAEAHARAVSGGAEMEAVVESVEGGSRLTVTATDGSASSADRIRGLGFAGLLVLDDHHARHHWMLATGAAPPGHR